MTKAAYQNDHRHVGHHCHSARRAGGCFLAKAIADASSRRVSAVNYVEAAVVIDASGDPIASRRVDEFFKIAQILIQAVTQTHAQIARDAYRDFGKGSGHPAKLNFGDCFAYALAKSSGEPLLFKGNDFMHTDITSVLPP